jgi:hypothetical protein
MPKPKLVKQKQYVDALKSLLLGLFVVVGLGVWLGAQLGRLTAVGRGVLLRARASRLRVALLLALVSVSVGVTAAVTFTGAKPAETYAATTSTMNFQARLMNLSGAIVPDGNYNVEFKLYNSSSSTGSSQSSCTGDANCLWTETDTGANIVQVKNGYLTVNLGANNPFPTTINWDQQLWLTMRIGGTGAPSWDTEMSPKLALTAIPYAFKAGQLAQFNSGTGFTSTLSLVQPTIGNQIFQIPDQAAAGTYSLLTTTTANAAYLKNSATNSTGNFSIQSASSASITGVLRGAASQSADMLQVQNSSGVILDSIDSTGTLNVNTASSTGININQAGLNTPFGGFGRFQNLLTYSEQQDNANWLKTNLTVAANNTVAPDGTTTADLATISVSGTNSLYQTITVTPATTYVLSWWAKAGTATTASSGIFDVTHSANIIAPTAYAITSSAWQRFSTTFTTPAGTTSVNVMPIYNAASTGTMSVWGAQLEQASSSGTYVQTVGTAASTANNGLVVNSTGSSVFNGAISAVGNISGATVSASNGIFATQANTSTTSLYVQNSTSSIAPVAIFKAGATPTATADFLELQNTSNIVLTKFNSNGDLKVGSASSAASATALQVVNAATNAILTVDASANQVTLGAASALSGLLTFATSGGAGTISLQAPSSATSYTSVLASAIGVATQCLSVASVASTTQTLGYASCANTTLSNLVGPTAIGTDLTFANGAARTVGVAQATAGTAGNDLTLTAGAGNGINQAGGNLILSAGAATGTGTAGTVIVKSPTNSTTAFQVQDATGASLLTADTTNDNLTTGDLSVGSPVNVGSSGRLFSDGFESGTISQWGSPVNVTIDTAQARNSKYALKLNGAPAASNLTSRPYTPSTTVYARAYFYTNANGNGAPDLMQISNSTIGVTSIIAIYRNDANSNFLTMNYNNGVTVSSTTLLPLNQWNKLELRATASNSSAGTVQVYLNNVIISALTVTGVNTIPAGPQNFDTINLGDSGSSTQTVWVDDVAVDTVPTGNSASFNVADSLHVSGSSTFSGNLVVQTTSNSGSSFSVQNSSGAAVLLVDTTSTSGNGLTVNYLTYPGFEAGVTGTTPTGWAANSSTVTLNTAKTNTYNGLASAQVSATAAAGAGLTTTSFSAPPAVGNYFVSFYAKQVSGTAMTSGLFQITGIDGTTHSTTCTAGITLATTGFRRVTCTFAVATSALTSMTISQTDANARVYYIDAIQLQSTLYNGGAITAPTAYQIGEIMLRGVITNPVAITNNADSTNEFQVTNAAGTNQLFNIDSLNSIISVGTTNTVNTSSVVNIANTSGATGTQTVSLGSSANAANSLTLEAGNTGQIVIGAAAVAHTINIGNNATGIQTIAIGGTTATSKITLSGGIINTVTNADGIIVGGGATNDANLVPFTLDTSSTYAETASTCSNTVNFGTLYYNYTSNAIRTCIRDAANSAGNWEDVVTTAGLGIVVFGVVPDSGLTASQGDLSSVTGSTAGPCKVSVGATLSTVSWTSCVAYSGGRKVSVAAGTAATTNSTAFQTQHLCLTNNGQPALTAAGPETTFTGVIFSANNPILCIADIGFAAASNTITEVYDTRVYSTTTKTFANVTGSSPCNGMLVRSNGTAGQFVIDTLATNRVYGVVVATSGGSTANTVNAIVATAGPVNIKTASAPTNNQVDAYVIPSVTGGYANISTTPNATVYGNAGLSQNTISTSCTINADTCHRTVFLTLNIR